MTEPRKTPPQQRLTLRDRRLRTARSLLDMQHETGIHRARLSQIELGGEHSLNEHMLIEGALLRWEGKA